MTNVYVELHALTSHSPGNLNRDDLGAPKTAVFGGVIRLRISSQCLKRSWRKSPFFRGELAESELGIRTAMLPGILHAQLTAEGLNAEAADGLVGLLAALGKTSRKEEEPEEEDDEAAESEDLPAAEKRTAHLLFLSQQEIAEIREFARQQQEKLESIYEVKTTKRGKVRKIADKPLQALRKALGQHLRERCARNAVDVALFGRFMTSDEIPTVDAAMQVAHALGTQKVEIEYDYFSAMDDWKNEPGAGHIGESEFAASVFYKYAVCDLSQLRRNLNGDAALAARALKAVALAMARAVPSGKKNSTAPQNPADYLEVVVRRDAPISLANAFLAPIRPEGEHSVMDRSILALRAQARKYAAVYGEDVIGRVVLCLRDLEIPAHAANTPMPAVNTLATLADFLEKTVAPEDLISETGV